MNISLTPKLESLVRSKVESGYYNNASEVVREALRLMETHENLLAQAKLMQLREQLDLGAKQIASGEYTSLSDSGEIVDFFQAVKQAEKR